MTDRLRRTVTLRCLAATLAVVLYSLVVSGVAGAQTIPVRFYVSPADDGIGGGTLHLIATGIQDEDPTALPFLPLTVAVWADPSTAAGGQGVFSLQDVSIARAEEVEFFGTFPSLEDFTCTAPGCQVGPRPDPNRDRVFAAGDDTSPAATLNGPFRVGYLTVIGVGQGTVSLVAGTALDADGQGGPLEIDGLPNEGTLIRFVPEPAAVPQLLAGASLLAALGARRRSVGTASRARDTSDGVG